MSFAAIGGAAATAVIGGVMGGGGGSGGSPSIQRTDPFEIQGGMFSGSGFDEDGNINMQMSEQMQALQNMNFGQATDFAGRAANDPLGQQANAVSSQFMGQLGNFDTNQLTANLFAQQSPILQAQHDRANFDAEARRRGQGTFGSSIGANQQQALFTAQGGQMNALLAQNFGQAQQAQQNLAANANMFAGINPARSATFAGIGNQGQGAGLNIQSSLLDTLNTGQAIASTNVGAVADTVSPGSAFGGGLLTSGAEQFTGAIEGFDFGTLFGNGFIGTDGPGGSTRIS